MSDLFSIVNAVCFADESSTNILVSGSDDGYVKVWSVSPPHVMTVRFGSS